MASLKQTMYIYKTCNLNDSQWMCDLSIGKLIRQKDNGKWYELKENKLLRICKGCEKDFEQCLGTFSGSEFENPGNSIQMACIRKCPSFLETVSASRKKANANKLQNPISRELVLSPNLLVAANSNSPNTSSNKSHPVVVYENKILEADVIEPITPKSTHEHSSGISDNTTNEKKLMKETDPDSPENITAERDDPESHQSLTADSSEARLGIHESDNEAEASDSDPASIPTLNPDTGESKLDDPKHESIIKPEECNTKDAAEPQPLDESPAIQADPKPPLEGPNAMEDTVSSLFEPQELTSLQRNESLQVILDLQSVLKRRYENVCEFLKIPLPSGSVGYWNALIGTWNNENLTKNIIASLKPGYTTLVSGNPGFGKSSLCAAIATQWCASNGPLDMFDLCVVLPCSVLQGHTSFKIRKTVREYCSSLLEHKSYLSQNPLLFALCDMSPKILVLLEDYDACEEKLKFRIQEFLQEGLVYGESAILVTTRPVEDETFYTCFESIETLRGHSADALGSQLAKLSGKDQTRAREFVRDETNRLNYLTGMPPRLYSVIKETILDGAIQDSCSLYNLLNNVLARLKRKKECPSETFDASILKLGRLFLEGLVEGHRVFTEKLLCENLGDAFDFIACGQIIYKVRGTSENVNVWSVVNKLWMVFIATKYVRHLWMKCRNESQRVRFMQKILNFSGCDGYYVSSTSSSRLYYVGLLPEIVLSFGNHSSLEGAQVEMNYDVEDVEFSCAFDSVILLNRLDRKFRSKYGFHSLSDQDEVCQAILGNILTEADAEMSFALHHNSYEDKYFATFTVAGTNDDSVIFKTTYRANTESRVDKLHIEFSLLERVQVLKHLKKALTMQLSNFELSDECSDKGYFEFVYSLVLAIAQSRGFRSVRVTCEGRCKSESDGLRQLMDFDIYPSSPSIRFSYLALCEEVTESPFMYDDVVAYQNEKNEIEDYAVPFFELIEVSEILVDIIL